MYRALLLAGATVVVSCAAQAPPPGDPRISLTPDAGVSADAPIVEGGPLLKASIRLVNPGPVDRPVLQTTDWSKANGLPVRTLLSAPQRMTVPRFGDATISLIAPIPDAVQFHTRVEPDYSAIGP